MFQTYNALRKLSKISKVPTINIKGEVIFIRFIKNISGLRMLHNPIKATPEITFKDFCLGVPVFFKSIRNTK